MESQKKEFFVFFIYMLAYWIVFFFLSGITNNTIKLIWRTRTLTSQFKSIGNLTWRSHSKFFEEKKHFLENQIIIERNAFASCIDKFFFAGVFVLDQYRLYLCRNNSIRKTWLGNNYYLATTKPYLTCKKVINQVSTFIWMVNWFCICSH